MDRLLRLRDEAVERIEKCLGIELKPETRQELRETVQRAVFDSALHGHETAVDAMLKYPLADQDKAHKIADEVRRANGALIANLSAQR
jgi:hypothetical protein